MAAKRLKREDIKAYREGMVARQKGICPLCKEDLQLEDAVLDHCHVSGNIRMALHRSCNAAEGRILHWAGVRSRGGDAAEFVRNLVAYWKRDFSTKPIHHTHGTKRKRRRTKTRRTNK